MKSKWIITVGREFCSGGAEIGHKVAEYFDIPYYDKKIIDKTAEVLHLSTTVVEKYDEKPISVWSAPGYQYDSLWYMSDPSLMLPLNIKVADAQFGMIIKFAEQGPCVIVGRCADYVLRSHPHVLNVFIRADMGMRVERAMRLYGIEAPEAGRLIKRTDTIRANYYNDHTGQSWGAPINYQLILDSGKLGVDAAAKAIESCIEQLSDREEIVL